MAPGLVLFFPPGSFATGVYTSSPVAFVARQDHSKADTTTTPVAVKDVARAVKKCDLTESFAKLIDAYSRNICDKRIDVETVLICQDVKDINLSDMRRNMLAEAKKASDLLPLVASIHNQLPTKCTKETFRSTRITEERQRQRLEETTSTPRESRPTGPFGK